MVYAARTEGTPTRTEEALEVQAFRPTTIAMGRAGVLERRSRLARLFESHGGERRRKLLLIARHAAVVLIVVAASLFGAYAALDTYDEERQLTVGQIELSADPGQHGALDLYVPLVDWGVRFEDAIRLPIRLNVDLRTVDRSVVSRVASGGTLSLDGDAHRGAGRDRRLPQEADRPRAARLSGDRAARGLRHQTPRRAAAPLHRRGLPDHDRRHRRRARGPLPPARQHRRAEVLRVRRRHPARAGRGRGRAELHPRARPGARRAARRPRPPGPGPGRADAAHGSSEHHDRVRPAQQLPRGADPRAGDRRVAAVLRRRPDRPRLADRVAGREPGQQHRRSVRLRLRQPRLGQPSARPRSPRRSRAHRARTAQAGRQLRRT